MSLSRLRLAVLIGALSVLATVPVTAQDTTSALRDLARQQVDERHLLEAVASRTLTWLTGSSSNNDYISVGRTANFFGFVALRVSSGHSLTRAKVARDTLAVLDAAQRTALVELLEAQKSSFARSQQARFAMNRALEGLLVGEPISKDAFLDLGAAYGAAEAELGRVIGQALGDLAQDLTDAQQAALVEIRAAHVSGRGDQIDSPNARIRLSREDKQELTNLAARFLSWTTGTPEFNDFEVVGKPSQHFGFVSLRIASNHGVRRGDVAKEVLSLMDEGQRAMLQVAAAHDAQAFGRFLEQRAQLMRTLEGALGGGVIDAADVAALGAAVGEIEAAMTWSQASAMLNVRASLTDAQSEALLAMRTKYTGGAEDALPDDPVARGRQLFAQCVLCHAGSGGVSVGPNLDGVVGRVIAGAVGFDGYSPALRSFAERQEVWSPEHLDRFLASPRALVPGTVMGFDGLASPQDRAAVIAYLETRP